MANRDRTTDGRTYCTWRVGDDAESPETGVHADEDGTEHGTAVRSDWRQVVGRHVRHVVVQLQFFVGGGGGGRRRLHHERVVRRQIQLGNHLLDGEEPVVGGDGQRQRPGRHETEAE